MSRSDLTRGISTVRPHWTLSEDLLYIRQNFVIKIELLYFDIFNYKNVICTAAFSNVPTANVIPRGTTLYYVCNMV